MNFLIHIPLGVLLYLTRICLCWEHFSSIPDITSPDSDTDIDLTYSEYVFGKCDLSNQQLQTHDHKNHTEIRGRIIVRGWINIGKFPSCIILRATSFEEDMFRSSAFRFQICVVRIAFCHTRKRHTFYFYEWFIPMDLMGSMNWDLYFYGPRNVG